MERVSELVQECLHLAECEQRRLCVGRLAEVHYHADVRSHIAALVVYPLSLILRHPRTALLSLAWEEVGIEYGQIASVLVEYLVGLNVWRIYLYVLVLLECYAVESVGQSEDAVYNSVETEVRAEHL